MAEQQATLFSNMSCEQGFDLLEDLVAVAQSGAAFGEPLTVGERTVITAAEVSSGLGYGYGLGAGTAPGTAEAQDGPSSGYGGAEVGAVDGAPGRRSASDRGRPRAGRRDCWLAALTMLAAAVTWRKMRR